MTQRPHESSDPAAVRGTDAGFVLESWLGTTVRCFAGRPLTLVHALDRAVRAHPDRIGVEGTDYQVGWGEFAELVEAAAEDLRGHGLRPGDVVSAALGNGLDIVVAIWACARAGLIFAGLPTRSAPSTWSTLLTREQPRLVLTEHSYADDVRAAASSAGLDPALVKPIGALLAGRRTAWRGEQIAFPDESSTYAVVYSSGTTGVPKSVEMVHRCAVHSAMSYLETVGLTGDDRTAITFPLYYVTGHIAQVLTMMITGGTALPVSDLSGPDLVDVIIGKQISYVMVAPSLWTLMLRDSRFRYPTAKCLVRGAFGGAPVPLSTITTLQERMPQLRLTDVYGLSENHSPITMLRDNEFRRKPGSVGRPLRICDVRVVDDEGADLPCGEVGELLARGPNITTGYRNDAVATAAAITDGWLRTGDYCRIDSEGFVYVLDRKKDVIIRGGFKVFSVEVEYALVSHPLIEAATAFGVPDRLAFEAVAVQVVTKPGADLSAGEVRDWVHDRVADYAVPRHVRFVESITRNRTGKVDKGALRAELVAELGARARPPLR